VVAAVEAWLAIRERKKGPLFVANCAKRGLRGGWWPKW
jgi:hypothetical protein